MEGCKGHEAHVVRLLDMFVARHPLVVCLIFELWCKLWCNSVDNFRSLNGYGRNGPQPPHHVRTLLLHVLRALSFLHTEFTIAHTDVKQANILVKFMNVSVSRDIECKLGDLDSVEEVASSPLSVAREMIK